MDNALGAVKEALGKFQQVQAGRPGEYSVLFRAQRYGFTCTNSSNLILLGLTLLATLAGFIHPFQSVMHSTNGADTLTSDWLG